jgi:single-stranded DNA-binding protein
MNRIQIIGRLVWRVERRRDYATGLPIGKAMIAVSSDERGLDFIPVTLHGQDAEDAAAYLGEGSKVEVVGHLHSVLVNDHGRGSARRMRRVLHVIADQVTYLDVCPPRGGDQS